MAALAGLPGARDRARAILRPIEGSREFGSVAELRAHYSAIAQRLYTVKKPWSSPTIEEIFHYKRRQTLYDILCQVSYESGISIDDMRGVSRQQKYSSARARFYYRAMIETPCSCVKIGSVIKKDHTTVLVCARRYAIKNGLPPVPWRKNNTDCAQVGAED